MTVTHIVSFRFEKSASQEERNGLHQEFLQLKAKCYQGERGGYIVDLIAGNKNISPEGAGKDFDVGRKEVRIGH
jgi:hypothetical protein